MSHIKVTLDDGTKHDIGASDATANRSLAGYLESHGFPLNTRCGKRGICCGCEVKLDDGSTVKSCQIPAEGVSAVEIPGRSQMEHQPQVGETFRIDVPSAHQPIFESVDSVDSEGGVCDTAFAIDLGTTTVVVMLIDLTSGEIIARSGGFNEQIRFGDNVLTRIDAAREPEALNELQAAVSTATFKPLIESACKQAERSTSRLAGGVIAGNTTMLHLLVGEDPTSLGIAPFIPQFIEGRRITADDINLQIDGTQSSLPIHLLPGIAAFIGADIVAGIYATGMMFDEKPSLLVDIGTNGEIVLQNKGTLSTCATAAGPAFEGAGLRCGTRARDGAISRLDLSLSPFKIEADIIGDIPLSRAAGICGSAYIDFLAEAREAGLLTASGRFDQAKWDAIPDTHKVIDDDERAIRLAGEDGRGGMMVSEVDIAVILQAKAAIGAGIEILLETQGIQANELEKVYLAGGFGMHLDVSHAIEIGLLPGFKTEQIEVVGNTSLAGAMLALVDKTTLKEMEEIRNHAEVIELNLQEDFEDCYIDNLMLP